MAFGQRRARAVEVTVKSFGEDRTLKVYPLTALETEQLRREYPPPVPPTKTGDGGRYLDTFDPEFVARQEAWQSQTLVLRLVRQLRDEDFGTDDPVEQGKLLMADFTEREFFELMRACLKVSTGEMTVEHVEAAKAQLVPFESGQPASAGTSPT